jgi:CRISPR-associated protein Csm3
MADDNIKTIKLLGRVLIRMVIRVDTGLHIGGSDTGIEIGGVDKTIIRDPLTNRPYIPGSSLRGKVRSLLEKHLGLPQNTQVANGFINSAKNPGEYNQSVVAQIFGVAGDSKTDFGAISRLVVRDVMLSEASAQKLVALGRTDLPFSEIKTEVSIDRVTSAANPRQMERVPAGVTFGELNPEGHSVTDVMVYSIYEGDNGDPQRDVNNFGTLVRGFQLLEDDYLGGLGSRGSGKVSLTNIQISVRNQTHYETAQPLGNFGTVSELAAALPNLQAKLRTLLGLA